MAGPSFLGLNPFTVSGQFVGEEDTPSPLDMTQVEVPAMTVPNLIDMGPQQKGGKGKQSKKETKQTIDQKNATTKNINYSQDEYNNLADQVRQLPEFQDQLAGIANLEEAYANAQNSPTGNRQNLLRAIAALTDAQTGSHFSQNIPAESDQDKRTKTLLDFQEKIQGKKGDLSKQLIEGIQKMKAGQETNSSSNQLAQMMGYTEGMLRSGGLGDPEDRMAFQAHQRNLQALKKDTTLAKITGNMQSIENALNNAAGVDKLTSEQFHELQQAIRSSLTKGVGSAEERMSTYYKPLNMSATEFMQWLDSKPKDLTLQNPFVKHVLEIGQLELGNMKKQAVNRANMLTSGNQSIYAKYPNYKADLEQAMGATEDLFSPNIDPKATAAASHKKGEKKVSKATKPIEEMTQAELDAYEKQLKGG